MQSGAITEYIDVAQVVLYAFWIFFAGLVAYLHRENKREGYPLESEGRGSRVIVQGFPPVPSPKRYILRSGREVFAPAPTGERQPEPPFNAQIVDGYPGSPILPAGDPMLAGVGPGSYAMRPDTPDLTVDDHARIVPLRMATALGVDIKDTDPRGLPVIGLDGLVGGTVTDLWVDRAEHLFRYLEVQPAGATGARPVLLPMGFARIKRRFVRVDSITAAQFAAVPRTKADDQITMYEEERVMAYYGAGTLYATPERAEPLL